MLAPEAPAAVEPRERAHHSGHAITRRAWLRLALTVTAIEASVGAGVAPAREPAPSKIPAPFKGPPKRIVSLVPSATEIIYALGGEERLVGRTDFCDWPPAAKQKPSVGGMIAPSLEIIATLKPDVVVMTPSGNRLDTRDYLARLGIPVYLVNAHRLAEMYEVVRRLAWLTAREDAAAPLIGRLGRRVDAVTRAVRPRPRRKVLYVLWPEPLIVPGRDAHITELIDLAGGISVTADEPGDYPRFSLEAVVARGPDVIVIARHSNRAAPVDRAKWERFTSLPAVQGNRLHTIEGNLIHRYGPRLIDGLDQLARLVHPEAFR